MKRRTQVKSQQGSIIVNKLDPGVFVVEIPEKNYKISLGQPPDVIKRLQQVGYYGSNAVDMFVLADSKIQDDSICWVLVEFPILYALYLCPVESNGKSIPAFLAGKYPSLIGLEPDVLKAHKMIKYGNYGIDNIEELDEMNIPDPTREALKKEILGLAVDNEIKESQSFVNSIYLEPEPDSEKEFSDIGEDFFVGRIGFNQYRFIYKTDQIDVDVNLQPDEKFRAPIEYKHRKFPVSNFGIWHTGEYDGMDPYFSCAHTSIIHKYEPILIDYPSNMTDIISHNGLSKQSIHHIIVTHNHDDHVGAMVELFRRNSPCHIITTEPVRFSLIKKISTLVDLPEYLVIDSFKWTILPFLPNKPFQTETLNLEGLKITGHLSCHCVPTTVYTFAINQEELQYTYGHFLDIVSFKRMKTMVKDGWMPKTHLDHLQHIVREKAYSLIKYDAGCANDATVPFSVHGQWQDLIDAATERSFRLFTHVTRRQLNKDFEKEGRFVRLGDLDSALRAPNGKLVRFGTGLNTVIPFFFQAYKLVLEYFESLVDIPPHPQIIKKMHHYAYIFANTPKQIDPNIGTFLIEQGAVADSVYIIVRGQAEIRTFDEKKNLIYNSKVGDGEVLGDIGVLAGRKRMASVKTLNRLSYLMIPSCQFIEAMNALNISYEGNFKETFERRLQFQAARDVSQDVSTITLNRVARYSRMEKIKKGTKLIQKGEKDDRLIIAQGAATISVGGQNKRLNGINLVGECEFFLFNKTPSARLHMVSADTDMEILILDADKVRNVPVIVDNIRRIIRSRKGHIYKDIPQIDQTQ